MVGTTAAEKAVEKGILKAKGLYEHEEPSEVPRGLREDLTTLNIVQVGQIHQYYTGMLAYMMTEAAKADMRHTAAKSHYNHLMKVKKFQIAGGSDDPMWKVEAQLEDDKEVKEAYTSLLEAEAYNTLVASKTKGLELKASMTSREITRRTTERERS